jgi:WD40 repeat protein
MIYQEGLIQKGFFFSPGCTSHAAPVIAVAFSPEGTRLATASFDTTAEVWDIQTGQLLYTLTGHTTPVTAVAFSPEGARLVTTSEDKTAKVWDVQTGQLLYPLEGHPAPVVAVAVSAEEKCPATGQVSKTCVATASADGTVKVWNACTGQELLSIAGPPTPVIAVAFSAEERRLDTVSADATVRSYALDIKDLMAEARERVREGALTLSECKRFFHQEQCPPVPSSPVKVSRH